MNADSKKAVLFDCDGVLVNTGLIDYSVLRIMLGEHDFGYTREEYLDVVSGCEGYDAINLIRDDFKRQKGYDLPEDFGEQLWARARQEGDEFLEAIEDIHQTLETLAKSDIPVAVCSNGDRDIVREHLQKAGLAAYFGEHVYTKDDVKNPKPAPDLYKLGAARLGVRPEDCVVVEDSQIGTTAGVTAGARVIGFIGEEHRRMEKWAFFKEVFLLASAGATTIATSGADLKERLVAELGTEKSPYPLYAMFAGQRKKNAVQPQ